MTATRTLPRWRQHGVVLLGLLALGLAFFAAADYGNNLGIDDWIHFYQVVDNGSINFASRPLSQIFLGAVAWFAGSNYATYHVVLVAAYIASGFLTYLLVWQVAPDQPLFAFAAGALALTFFVNDFFLLLTWIYTSGAYAALIFALLALNAFAAALRLESSTPARLALFALAAGLAFATLLIYEAAAPLLGAAPLLIALALRGRLDRWGWLGLVLWVAALLLAMRGTLLALLGLGGGTYGSSLYKDLDPARMLAAVRAHFRFAFRQLLVTDMQKAYPYRLHALIVGGVALLAMQVVRRVLPVSDTADGIRRANVLRAALWAAAGALGALLGFAAFLPTVFADSVTRTHIITRPGEGVLLAAAVWLAASVVRSARWRRVVQAGGVALVAMYGAVMLGQVQTQLYDLAGTWDNTAHFMRSLSNLAPEVEDFTLIVYVENPDVEEAPFTSGFSFQYAVRHFYGNTATGLIPTDSILGEWAIVPDGIRLEENWGDSPDVIGWDEMIFFTRDDAGTLALLDELPGEFYTAERQVQYDPHARIHRAYVPPAIRRAFPIVESPDLLRQADTR